MIAEFERQITNRINTLRAQVREMERHINATYADHFTVLAYSNARLIDTKEFKQRSAELEMKRNTLNSRLRLARRQLAALEELKAQYDNNYEARLTILNKLGLDDLTEIALPLLNSN